MYDECIKDKWWHCNLLYKYIKAVLLSCLPPLSYIFKTNIYDLRVFITLKCGYLSVIMNLVFKTIFFTLSIKGNTVGATWFAFHFLDIFFSMKICTDPFKSWYFSIETHFVETEYAYLIPEKRLVFAYMASV